MKTVPKQAFAESWYGTVYVNEAEIYITKVTLIQLIINLFNQINISVG